jgi:ketosteroid isomerase-like protein
MSNRLNSIAIAKPRRLPGHRPRLSTMTLLVLAIMTVVSGGHASAQPIEAEARALLTKFVAAQNAHDVGEVKSMLWNSPDMLFFSRGLEVRGRDAAADRFKEYYEGTWHLEPDMSKFRVSALSDDVVQILVPIIFTRGLPGAQPQSNTFLISQSFVRDAQGWHIASILPVANTQLK